MAPTDEENIGQKKHNDANPFILFRRFADQQMSTLMSSVFNISLPFGSANASPRHSIDDYEKWLQEARKSSQRLTREAEEASKIMDVYTRAQQDGQRAVQHPERHWVETPDLVVCPPDDAILSCSSLAALGRCLQSTLVTAPILGDQVPSVPVAYLLYSPYSPVWLEQQPRLGDHGARWREAFEDLLVVQSGWEIPPKCSRKAPESRFDWVMGMLNLASYKREENTEESSTSVVGTSEAIQQDPGPLSHFHSARQPTNHAIEDEDADNDELCDEREAEFTELDIYNVLFGLQQPSPNNMPGAAARSFAHSQQDSSLADTGRGDLGILSTLTTTERTTLQDGSVHTRVVLKKRFADGREESTQTEHHQNAIPQTRDAASKSVEDEGIDKIGRDKGRHMNKTSGWFWS